MKIYYRVSKPYQSNALRRIEEGIQQTLPPGFVLVPNQEEADLCICPVVSIHDAQGMPENSIIFQLCYETAGGSRTNWEEIWSQSLMVVSYLKLPIDWYLRMPLGYDPALFNTQGRPQISKYDIVVTGYVDEQEGGEVISRLTKHFNRVMHIGKNLALRTLGYFHAENISDNQLAEIYRQSKFVAGMRMVEGFELPIIEGAACGAKPITLDMECYLYWFEDIAFFADPEHLDEDLGVLSNLVYNDRFIQNVQAFTWDKVMTEFWSKILKEAGR